VRVIWTPQALQDRTDIWNHIQADNAQAASRMDELFSQAAAHLCNHPKLGKPGKIQGTRELIPHENYRLVYEISNETVWLLTLIHVARQWPLNR
jgi:toxin ParE1/3/4